MSSRNNLPKMKDGTYVINVDEYISIESHAIALYVKVIMGAHLQCNVLL